MAKLFSNWLVVQYYQDKSELNKDKIRFDNPALIK